MSSPARRGLADSSSCRCSADAVLIPGLFRDRFCSLLLRVVFNACVLKFHKIVGLFLFLVLATQWVLSIQKLCPSVLGYFLPLFFGNFPPCSFCSLFWKFLLRIGLSPKSVLWFAYFFCFAFLFCFLKHFCDFILQLLLSI